MSEMIAQIIAQVLNFNYLFLFQSPTARSHWKSGRPSLTGRLCLQHHQGQQSDDLRIRGAGQFIDLLIIFFNFVMLVFSYF